MPAYHPWPAVIAVPPSRRPCGLAKAQQRQRDRDRGEEPGAPDAAELREAYSDFDARLRTTLL